jgi:hypothetical protein
MPRLSESIARSFSASQAAGQPRPNAPITPACRLHRPERISRDHALAGRATAADLELPDAGAVFIRRITPCDRAPMERLFDIAVRGETAPLISSPETPWRFSSSRIGPMSTSLIRRLTSSARSACSRSPTSDTATGTATATAGDVRVHGHLWRSGRLQPSAEQRFCPVPSASDLACRRTAAAIGTGRLRRLARLRGHYGHEEVHY